MILATCDKCGEFIHYYHDYIYVKDGGDEYHICSHCYPHGFELELEEMLNDIELEYPLCNTSEG